MEQQKIWDHLQNEGLTYGHFSEARPRVVARYLRPGTSVLNVGVGAGTLEALCLAKGVGIHSVDPSPRTIERLRVELGMGERAQVGYGQALPFRPASGDPSDNRRWLQRVWRIGSPATLRCAASGAVWSA